MTVEAPAEERTFLDFTDARQAIADYNRHGLHYNLVAEGVYAARKQIGDPFDPSFLPYLVAALISFDMGRQLDVGPGAKYGPDEPSFAHRLGTRLAEIAPLLRPLTRRSLVDVALDEHVNAITIAYTRLASGGESSLSANGNAFDVGATKILHFLNPELFLIVDRNVARSLAAARRADGSPLLTSKSGYSGTRYVQSLEIAREWITDYGVDRFQAIKAGTPLMRIFDKIAFARGVTASAALV